MRGRTAVVDQSDPSDGQIETSIGRTAEMAGYADTPEGLRAFERVRLNGITSERYATIAPMAQQVVMREHVWGHLDGSIKKDLTLVAAVLESSDRRGRQLLVDACIVSEVAKANLKSGTISSAATGPYAIFVLEEIDRALGRATYEAELATRAQVGGLFEATAVDSKAMPALVEVLERISVVNEADAYVAMSANEIGWTRRDHRYMIDDLHATRDPRGTEDDSSAEDGHGRPFLRGNS